MNDVQFDETKKYFDFYLLKGQPQLVEIELEGTLEKLTKGELAVDSDFKDYLMYLSRWTVEAPRKKGLRKMRLEGIQVLTSEVLFDEEETGEEIINNLENTGKFAEYFLEEVYGTKN